MESILIDEIAGIAIDGIHPSFGTATGAPPAMGVINKASLARRLKTLVYPQFANF